VGDSRDRSPTVGVAVSVPEPWASLIQEHRASFGDRQAWTIPTHITLLPPTRVDPTRIREVDEHLVDAASYVEPFVVELRGTGTFRPVTPTVYVVVAQGVGGCEQLEARVRSGPLRRRLRYPYHPHVTVACEVPDEQLDRAYAALADMRATFTVTDFVRYQLGEEGLWTPARSFPLAQ
jgi:2'-5' RNA ligase